MMSSPTSCSKKEYEVIRKLDLDSLTPSIENGGGVFAVIGSMCTGKSTLVKSILEATKNMFSQGTFINNSPTKYDGVLTKTDIFYEFDKSIINEFIERQKVLNSEFFIERQRMLNSEKNPNHRACIVLDDCMVEENFRETELKSLIINGRHWNITTFVVMQYTSDIHPCIRTSFQGVFVFPNSNKSIHKKIWEQYAGCIPEFSQFCEILNSLPAYTALFIDNRGMVDKWQDRIFQYTATL